MIFDGGEVVCTLGSVMSVMWKTTRFFFHAFALFHNIFYSLFHIASVTHWNPFRYHLRRNTFNKQQLNPNGEVGEQNQAADCGVLRAG